MITQNTVAEFTWNFGSNFLLETQYGNFVWSDPDYGGDNTIRPYAGNPINFTQNGLSGRYKGRHIIRNYCGDKVIFM